MFCYYVCGLLIYDMNEVCLGSVWFVVLVGIFFHFYLFHPEPTPRPGKCCQYKKHLKIALCGRIIWKCDIYRMIVRVNLILLKWYDFFSVNQSTVLQNVARYVLRDMRFLVYTSNLLATYYYIIFNSSTFNIIIDILN